MDYKKAYKEALERAKKMLASKRSVIVEKQALETIFPELKESEDERMRKRLLNLFKGCPWDSIDDGMLKRDDIINWLEKQGETFTKKDVDDAWLQGMCDAKQELEKQGEQKFAWSEKDEKMLDKIIEELTPYGECPDYPSQEEREYYYNRPKMIDWLKSIRDRVSCTTEENAPKDFNSIDPHFGIPIDNINPKFKEGDWIVVGDMVGQITGVQEDCYIGRDTYGWYFALSKPEGNSTAHLWTIEDARDGDVLVWDDNKCIALFKNIDDEESFISYGYVGHCTGVFESGESYHDIEGVYPATKEQRDLLFQKMKEAGYGWDSQNNSLSKI